MKRSSGKLYKALVLSGAFMRLVRWPNLLIIILTHFLMRYFILATLLNKHALKLQLPFPEFLMLSLSVVFISAAGYVINDYFDRKTDIINKPGRVLIGRYFHRRFAMFIHLVFNLIALSLGAYVCFAIHIPELTVVFLMVIGVLYFYSTTYKRQLFIGNFIVSLFAGLVPLMVLLFEVPVLRANYGRIIPLMGAKMSLYMAWIGGFALFAFLANFIREVVKDIQDVEGDTAYGRKTAPVVWGIEKTKWILLILHAVFIVLLLLVNLVFIRDMLSFLYTLVLLVIPLATSTYLIFIAETNKQYQIVSNLIKVIMLLGIIYAVLAKYYVL